eukprot:6193164-Pleurochrysis_carterae.AAC.3
MRMHTLVHARSIGKQACTGERAAAQACKRAVHSRAHYCHICEMQMCARPGTKLAPLRGGARRRTRPTRARQRGHTGRMGRARSHAGARRVRAGARGRACEYSGRAGAQAIEIADAARSPKMHFDTDTHAHALCPCSSTASRYASASHPHAHAKSAKYTCRAHP